MWDSGTMFLGFMLATLAIISGWKIATVLAVFGIYAVDAIYVVVRGGYGCSRILELIDYDLIAKNPKIMVGMSDITILNNAIFAKSGLVNYQGPMVADFESNDLKTREHLKRVLFYGEKNLLMTNVDVVTEGSASGVLVGGNLSSFRSLIGTEYLVENQDVILLIEEVSEYAYKMDRDLWQLRNSGFAKNIKGVVVGDVIAARGDNYPKSLDILLKDVFGEDMPIVKNAMFGHGGKHLTLPIGETVKLDITKDKQIMVIK